MGAKPLKGYGGAGVVEVVESYEGNAHRTVYTVIFNDAPYDLRALEKKSTKGIATSPRDLGLIRQRFAGGSRCSRSAEQVYDRRLSMTKHIDYQVSSGNVVADIGGSQPEEANAKAELALQINRLIEHRALTQTEAAKVLGIKQPKVSALMRGQLTGFSIERLIRFRGSAGCARQRATERSHPQIKASCAPIR